MELNKTAKHDFQLESWCIRQRATQCGVFNKLSFDDFQSVLKIDSKCNQKFTKANHDAKQA